MESIKKTNIEELSPTKLKTIEGGSFLVLLSAFALAALVVSFISECCLFD